MTTGSRRRILSGSPPSLSSLNSRSNLISWMLRDYPFHGHFFVGVNVCLNVRDVDPVVWSLSSGLASLGFLMIAAAMAGISVFV